MRLLFITDQVDYPGAINPILARRVAGELAAMGHTVELLELWDGVTPLPDVGSNVIRYTLECLDEYQMNEALEHGRPGTPVSLRLARLAIHPTGVAAAFRQLVLHRPHRQIKCQAWLESHDYYDHVIAVGAPYYAAFALSEAKISAEKAVWMMDPYSANTEYIAPGGAEKELAMAAQMERVFITQLMVPDYENGSLSPIRPKTRVLEFPCMIPGVEIPTQPSQELRLVFCGSLYPSIRTPWRLLELASQLNLPDFKLVMVGQGWEHFDPVKVEEYKAKLGDRLELLGVLPYSEAQKEMARADVLINLGNGIVNQLPSKIFDYFGTGKPVVQLAARMDDPANDYFSRYPLALIMRPEDAPDKLEGWLKDIRGKRITYADAARLFHDNTPSAVAQALLDGLEEASR